MNLKRIHILGFALKGKSLHLLINRDFVKVLSFQIPNFFRIIYCKGGKEKELLHFGGLEVAQNLLPLNPTF